MATAAPVIEAEMHDFTLRGGKNSGIVGNKAHKAGFHRAANEVPASDYSRTRDPNGSDGPYVNWGYSCAGDFYHGNNPKVFPYVQHVLQRLLTHDPKLSMIFEYIGRAYPGGPVMYYNKATGLKRYTGEGHDTWSHIAWYRSRVNQRAYLFTSVPAGENKPTPPKPTAKPSTTLSAKVKTIRVTGVQNAVHVKATGKWDTATNKAAELVRTAARGDEIKDVKGTQKAVGANADGQWGPKSKTALTSTVKKIQRAVAVTADGGWGKNTEAAYQKVKH